MSEEQIEEMVEEIVAQIEGRPDPFEPTSVDLDDIFDDEELEGLVACSKDDPECESCS